jgi:hypothetical protein
MKYDLPCFEELVKIAANNPEKLDEIRELATESLIESAPDRCRLRLRGIQFQVDMEIRRSKSPLDGCVRVFNLMNDTLWRLNSTLNEAIAALEDTPFPNSKDLDLSEDEYKTAKILAFET